jgi:hypothetical protein
MKLSFLPFFVVAIILFFSSCKKEYVPWTGDLMAETIWDYKTVQTEVFEGTVLSETKIETLANKYVKFGKNDQRGTYETNLPKEDVPNQLETNPTTWRAMNSQDVILEGEDYYYPIYVKTINDKELIFTREYKYEEDGKQKRSVFTYVLEKQK